jgi:hypothetical protein
VIDELMDHERSHRGEFDGGSRIGARYRHTTPEMAVRVADAIQERLAVVVQVAEAILQLDESGGRVSKQVARSTVRNRGEAAR